VSVKSPLGEKSAYPATYSPALLHPISRAENRQVLGISGAWPFHGEDLWNAYELTWLDGRGKPCVATAELRVPANSPNIIESKSMKLYLNSHAMAGYAGPEEIRAVIANDLSESAAAPVAVRLIPLSDAAALRDLPGVCIDDEDVDCESTDADPGLLACTANDAVNEELHSHLLRCLCPVTDQPDMGGLLIRYRGRPIDRGALLRYIVSYRNHNDFHESCVERIFLDIRQRCEPEALTVYARYNRRGGIDINPFRSDFETTAENIRLARQ
jgi:7-cyano-7-deazaguanine reductase